MDVSIKENERIDDLQRNGYRILQDPDRFCFGMDAVLLSGFANAKEGDHVLDLGTGTGIIPILMEAKTKASRLVGLEIQTESADMALRSVKLNNLEDKINIVVGDIKSATQIFGKASFDIITSNPPYMIGQHGLVNPHSEKAIARHEVLCTLEDVVIPGSVFGKARGKVFYGTQPFSVFRKMNVMTKYHLEPKRMQLVYPYVDKEPNMVLIEAKRGGNSRLKVEKPLIVYKETGKYTDEIYDVYGY